jgi:hypothetical protein
LRRRCRPSSYPTCLHAISLAVAAGAASAILRHTVVVVQPISSKAASVGRLFHFNTSVRCRLLADIVAKVFLGWRTRILRAADASHARRREGPYRFTQNRSRISVVALKSDAAAEKSKDHFREIFRVLRFSTFATISALFGPRRLGECPLRANSGHPDADAHFGRQRQTAEKPRFGLVFAECWSLAYNRNRFPEAEIAP